MVYVKQLDSVRAIAVIMVIISHWLPDTNILNKIPNGVIGVNIFFVLSGFLITTILFEKRSHQELLRSQKLKELGYFYVRRALRIFPAYYLAIGIMFLFSKYLTRDFEASFIYLLTYSSNFYMFHIKRWPDYISHFWSLAVEEQFYLIWPWFVIFIREKALLSLIVLFILTGIIGQKILADVKFSSVLTFNCFDAFGIGALLAWVLIFAPRRMNLFYGLTAVSGFISMLLFFYGMRKNAWLVLPLRTLISLVTLWLLTYIMLKRNLPKFSLGFILNNRIMIELGKISYGLYIFHNMIPHTLNDLFLSRLLNPHLPGWAINNYRGIIFVLENTMLLLIVSWLSYRLVEKPFLNLKKYWPAV